MYDAKAGRWLSQDPLLFDAGDPDLYRYVENEPTNKIDPEGTLDLGYSSPPAYVYPGVNSDRLAIDGEDHKIPFPEDAGQFWFRDASRKYFAVKYTFKVPVSISYKFFHRAGAKWQEDWVPFPVLSTKYRQLWKTKARPIIDAAEDMSKTIWEGVPGKGGEIKSGWRKLKESNHPGGKPIHFTDNPVTFSLSAKDIPVYNGNSTLKIVITIEPGKAKMTIYEAEMIPDKNPF